MKETLKSGCVINKSLGCARTILKSVRVRQHDEMRREVKIEKVLQVIQKPSSLQVADHKYQRTYSIVNK